jgi:hypothetical protein
MIELSLCHFPYDPIPAPGFGQNAGLFSRNSYGMVKAIKLGSKREKKKTQLSKNLCSTRDEVANYLPGESFSPVPVKY